MMMSPSDADQNDNRFYREKSTDSLRHWSALSKTDPSHTKSFQRSGGFKGTAIRPVWTELRMTEHFGPCGIGWGMDKPEYTLVPAGDELLVYCVVGLWYRDGEMTATVYGVGGDKVLARFRTGIASDDEAFKKAFTDAIGNGMKHIGMSADVHMGRFEDSKYVQEARRDAGKRLAEWAGGAAAMSSGRDAVSPAASASLGESDALRDDLNATAESKAAEGSDEFRAWWSELPRHERDLIRGMLKRYEGMAQEADYAY